VRAQKYMQIHSADEISGALTDEFRGGMAKDAWTPGYTHSSPAYTKNGEIPLEGVRAVIQTNAYFLSSDAKIDAATIYDTASSIARRRPLRFNRRRPEFGEARNERLIAGWRPVPRQTRHVAGRHASHCPLPRSAASIFAYAAPPAFDRQQPALVRARCRGRLGGDRGESAE